jgi:hypothetical protein
MERSADAALAPDRLPHARQSVRQIEVTALLGVIQERLCPSVRAAVDSCVDAQAAEG